MKYVWKILFSYDKHVVELHIRRFIRIPIRNIQLFLYNFETGDKTELIVAAGFCGAVIGALITIGIWMLQRKLSMDKMW